MCVYPDEVEQETRQRCEFVLISIDARKQNQRPKDIRYRPDERERDAPRLQNITKTIYATRMRGLHSKCSGGGPRAVAPSRVWNVGWAVMPVLGPRTVLRDPSDWAERTVTTPSVSASLSSTAVDWEPRGGMLSLLDLCFGVGTVREVGEGEEGVLWWIGSGCSPASSVIMGSRD